MRRVPLLACPAALDQFSPIHTAGQASSGTRRAAIIPRRIHHEELVHRRLLSRPSCLRGFASCGGVASRVGRSHGRAGSARGRRAARGREGRSGQEVAACRRRRLRDVGSRPTRSGHNARRHEPTRIAAGCWRVCRREAARPVHDVFAWNRPRTPRRHGSDSKRSADHLSACSRRTSRCWSTTMDRSLASRYRRRTDVGPGRPTSIPFTVSTARYSPAISGCPTNTIITMASFGPGRPCGSTAATTSFGCIPTIASSSGSSAGRGRSGPCWPLRMVGTSTGRRP